MSANIKQILWTFFFGMTTGALMAITLKYPVSGKVIIDATGLCAANLGLDKFKIGLSGKMYYVKCKDGKSFTLK
jgi:hypothetical protein